MPGGRPSVYDERVATKILDRIAGGELLTHICRERGMPKLFTVTSWVSRNHEGFGDRYWEARASQAVVWSEQVLEILDDARKEDSMARAQIARSRSDARKWMLSRMIPSRFSDRLQVDHHGQRAEVHIWLPGKGSAGDRAKVIEGQARQVESQHQALEDGIESE
jgi:hypothetical protein